MPNIKKSTNQIIVDPLSNAINEIHKKTNEKEEKKQIKIVDIITFCNSNEYLNLPGENFNLWISQKVILKTFYMGTIGNENLKLDKEEWEWLYRNESDEEFEDMKYEKNIKDVIKKITNRERSKNESEYFKILHLVLGRRSSKTILSSIITAYEAYKLLVINNGDPHAYYNLPHDDEIAIINVALSLNQAGRLFNQVQARLRNAPFFKNRIAKQTSSEIRLFTDSDLRKKEEGANISVNGSILLLCGHSNPDSLAGYSAILLLFDEIAFFDESGKVTGSYFFSRLKPSLAKFFKFNAARIVMISSPNTRSGIFYETAIESKSDDSILSYQLPTWCMNPDIPYDNEELKRDREANIEMFSIEYGAQWASGGSFGNYFDEGLIDRIIRGDIGPHLSPLPRFNYYIHVDPAKRNNNYTAVMVAKEFYTDNFGKRRNRIFLAGVWIWRPMPGIGLIFHEIDKEMIKICAKFHPITVTYDDYHSMHSLELLRSHGVNTRQLPFNRSVKQKIYQNLKDLMAYIPNPELYLYDDGESSSLLIGELKSLKFKKINRGISLVTDKNGDIKTDDAADCLAGACFSANEAMQASLPLPVTVYTGLR